MVCRSNSINVQLMSQLQLHYCHVLRYINSFFRSSSNLIHLASTPMCTQLYLTYTYRLSSPSPSTLSIPFSLSYASPLSTVSGPLLTINVITSYSVSAAAIVVNSAFVSYAGATSTISAATKLIPSSPLIIVLNSLVDHPPVSGVPVAGANAGSRVSMSMER